MNKKSFSLIATIALSAFFNVSCEKKEVFEAPVISEMTAEPAYCHPGEEVIIRVPYKSAGKNWYFSNERFTMDDSIRAHLTYATYDENDSRFSTGLHQRNGAYSEPMCTFVAPDTAGVFTIGFSGQINKTAASPDESLWGERITRSVTVTITK